MSNTTVQVQPKAPTADEIWTRWRWTPWGEIARHHGMKERSMREAARRAGFRRSSAPGSPLTHAPCAACGRKFVPVEELDDNRVCRPCAKRRRVEPTDKPWWKDLYEKERERFLTRYEAKRKWAHEQIQAREERLRAAGWIRDDVPIYALELE